jgi:hypothetical protein
MNDARAIGRQNTGKPGAIFSCHPQEGERNFHGAKFHAQEKSKVGRKTPEATHNLHGLAGDAERQVLAIHHALDEAEVVWQKVLCVLLDEDASRVEVHSGIANALRSFQRE